MQKRTLPPPELQLQESFLSSFKRVIFESCLFWGRSSHIKPIYLVVIALFLADLLTAQRYLEVSELCYDEGSLRSIELIDDVQIDSLPIYEKMMFEPKRLVQSHHKYFENGIHATHDVYFVSQENVTPEWYMHPSLMRTNSSGMRSYFSEGSSYFDEGWVGAGPSSGGLGVYVEDKRKGLRYLEMDHTEISLSAFSVWENKVETIGFLAEFVYAPPTRAELQILSDNGFTVVETQNFVRVHNENFVVDWDLSENSMVISEFIGHQLSAKNEYQYAYSKRFDAYLLHSEINSKIDSFGSGEKYWDIEFVIRNNYSGDCNSTTSLSWREDVVSSNRMLESESTLKLTPNPASGDVVIQIPDSEQSSQVYLSSIQGETLIFRKVDSGESTLTLDISGLPSGVYLVNCLQGDVNHISKIVKK